METGSHKAKGGVYRASEIAGYSPANHEGTVNIRLIGPDQGAKHMEVVLGDIVRSGVAHAHAHPDLEQSVYVLEGSAVVGIDGVEHQAQTGDIMFFPAGVFHSIRVTSERIKLLVIYSPPYQENPEQVVLQSESSGLT